MLLAQPVSVNVGGTSIMLALPFSPVRSAVLFRNGLVLATSSSTVAVSYAKHVRACVRACVRPCMRASVHACVRARGGSREREARARAINGGV